MQSVARDPDRAVPARAARPLLGEATLLVGVDVLAAVAVSWAAPLEVGLVFVAAVSVWAGLGLYARRFSLSVLDELPKLASGAAAGMAGVALLPGFSLQSTAATALLLLGAGGLGRVAAYRRLRRRRIGGLVTFPAVIVGAGPSALALARRIAAHPETGLRPVGFLDSEAPADQATGDLPAPMLGAPADLASVVEVWGVSDVIVAYGEANSESLVEVLRDCHRLPVTFHIVPRFFEMHRLAGGTDQIWGMPLENLRRRGFGGVSGYLKRAIDVVVAAVALVVLAPVMAAIAVAVRVELGPGIFFRQVRVGVDGRHFSLWKFRSMRAPARGREDSWASDDPERLGPVGAFIRRYSLDETPQFFNVLVGDMSLVGPRPERPEYVSQFGLAVPRYRHRARVPAGLTGLAAVEGLRGDTSLAERAYFDNLYIENWSPWLDVKIVARTLAAVVRGTGG